MNPKFRTALELAIGCICMISVGLGIFVPHQIYVTGRCCGLSSVRSLWKSGGDGGHTVFLRSSRPADGVEVVRPMGKHCKLKDDPDTDDWLTDWAQRRRRPISIHFTFYFLCRLSSCCFFLTLLPFFRWKSNPILVTAFNSTREIKSPVAVVHAHQSLMHSGQIPCTQFSCLRLFHHHLLLFSSCRCCSAYTTFVF